MITSVFTEPASKIADRHWQGGFPKSCRKVASAGVDVIVLCAQELQPYTDGSYFGGGNFEEHGPEDLFPGVAEVICAPMDDDSSGPTLDEVERARDAAQAVLGHLEEGRRVLVTCMAGRNRSGLVSGLVLCGRYGISGAEAVRRIKAARPKALSNEGFVRFLKGIPAVGP